MSQEVKQLAHEQNPLAASLTWDWQKVASDTVNDLDVLASLLDLDSIALASVTSNTDFALRVPLPFVARMQPGNLNDPLLLQVLPQKRENSNPAGFSDDPLQEHQYNVRPGLVHKYAGRVLLTAAVSCPINCRYCFRRHFPYESNRLTPKSWAPALQYVAQDESIREVILSGGEPLFLNDRMLSQLLNEIEMIDHVQMIRIHTRFPVVVPQRLNKALCNRLISSRCKIAMVLHCNHPNEINAHMKQCLQTLVSSPVTLLNQSVLLKGVNDNAATLVQLSQKLYDAGVLPYYLHATDPVNGAAHFQVSDTQARSLSETLTNTLPGYLVPTLVREVSGKAAKTRLAFEF